MDDSLKDTEWWWIDYLENEFDAVLERDLETLLQHSQEDRDSFENFRLLKQWLGGCDPVADWPLEDRTKRMRAGVMAAIANIDLEPTAPETKRRDRLRLLDANAEP